MTILAHRGIWRNKNQQNSVSGLMDAIAGGFGVELDIRDYCGNLVLSHDIADRSSPLFEDFLECYSNMNSNMPLAINVKSDGLAPLVAKAVSSFGVDNYFCFDMSVPEQFAYIRQHLKIAQRISNYDFMPSKLDACTPVWVDTFGEDQLPTDILSILVDGDALMAIVSTELHGHDHNGLWQSLRDWIMYKGLIGDTRVMLCTDFPFEAEEYFNGRH